MTEDMASTILGPYLSVRPPITQLRSPPTIRLRVIIPEVTVPVLPNSRDRRAEVGATL